MRILNLIIRNDAMKKDPPEIYGWRVYLLACTVCLHASNSAKSHTLSVK